jgi:hypothetical protein
MLLETARDQDTIDDVHDTVGDIVIADNLVSVNGNGRW